MGIQSIFTSTLRNPLPCAIIAGIATKITQMAISSVFRAPFQWVSLIARIEQLPGGQTLINYGPSILMSLTTWVALRLCRFVKQPISKTEEPYRHTEVELTTSVSEQKEPISYTAAHYKFDAYNHFLDRTPGRGHYGHNADRNCQIHFFPNIPKNIPHHFSDAFGYAENQQVQIVALADGCGWEKSSQLAARTLIDGFMERVIKTYRGAIAESCVMNAVQNSQKEIAENHQEDNPAECYGQTAFLGGIIFTATNNKRYFTGIHCGPDCKLYCLRDGKFAEMTNSVTSGKFGPKRTVLDKTEYSFSAEVRPGDRLLFMTSGIHENLDPNPPEKGVWEMPGQADKRKLSTLEKFGQDNLGRNIICSVIDHTAKYFEQMARSGQKLVDVSPKEIPGKADNMTLLVVTVK